MGLPSAIHKLSHVTRELEQTYRAYHQLCSPKCPHASLPKEILDRLSLRSIQEDPPFVSLTLEDAAGSA